MTNKLNVIIVCDYAYINGGAEKVAIESALNLDKKGINVIFFSAVGPIDNRLNESGVTVICLNQYDALSNPNKLYGMIQGIWNYKAYKKIENILDNYSPRDTIIHLHLWQKAISSSIMRQINKKGFKVVCTLHHYFLACPNGGFFNYKKKEICKITPMGCKCIITNCDKRNYMFKIYRVFKSLIEKKISKSQQYIKHYIYISDLGRNVIVPYLNPKSNYYFISNPITIKKSKRIPVTQNKALVFLGRLSEEKGVLELAQAAYELEQEVIFIGDGPCKSRILEINPNAMVTGWLEKKQVREELLKARTLVFPTLWYEGMPLSILEANSLGIPAIIPDSCAATQIIKDEYNGLIYNGTDNESFKNKIKKTFDNEYLERLSVNTYNDYWSNDYSIEEHSKRLIKTYSEILKIKLGE